ncbi:hypothetical protein [Clostridium swellfunianum]|nr:hypothetical protein [Clostridium swellfunianum]
MNRFKYVLETLYICILLMFFSKELINEGTCQHKKDFTNCGVSI